MKFIWTLSHTPKSMNCPKKIPKYQKRAAEKQSSWIPLPYFSDKCSFTYQFVRKTEPFKDYLWCSLAGTFSMTYKLSKVPLSLFVPTLTHSSFTLWLYLVIFAVDFRNGFYSPFFSAFLEVTQNNITISCWFLGLPVCFLSHKSSIFSPFWH